MEMAAQKDTEKMNSVMYLMAVQFMANGQKSINPHTGKPGDENLKNLDPVKDKKEYEAVYGKGKGVTESYKVPEGQRIDGSNKFENVGSKLTRAQNRNIKTLNNVIENNLKEHDFSGTLRDLKGDPVPKPGGGFWDHKTEMIQSYDSLQGVKKGLEGSLKNPNIDPIVKEYIQAELNKANSYINQIEELFKPFGGIK